MGVSAFSGRLICVLLVTTQVCFSNPVTQIKTKTVLPYPGCPSYSVGEDVYSSHVVALDRSLTFQVNPSHPAVVFDITVSSEMVYQAVVEGASLSFQQCDLDREHCQVMQEEIAKAANLLNANQWNRINVTLEGTTITVSVNQKKSLTQTLQSVVWENPQKSKGGHAHSNVKVSLLSAQISGYSLLVNLYCNETHSPEIEEVTMEPRGPEVVTQQPQPEPFETCPVHQVTESQPLEGIQLEEKLVMAVLPSTPSIQIKVSFRSKLYQATIDGSMTEVQKCSPDGTHCDMVDAGGVKGSDSLMANKWNYVTVSRNQGQVTFQVNTHFDLMGKGMSFGPDDEYAAVSILATAGISGNSRGTDSVIRVNIYCDDAGETTTNIHFTAAPIGETTVAPDDARDDSHVLRVIAIILAIIIVILVIALVYYCYTTKCKKGGAQSSYQLQEDAQQQH
ncbi:uncharacterized protein LOC135196202 [Macrobrachium nipponense]|uniref:uncharacterized protein LOC135196202 n=1 Tax=Macrobrachium nipponense TaxID=159736 RepID=UPI0030C80FC5